MKSFSCSQRALLFCLTAALLFASTACQRRITIGEIQGDPPAFEGKTVTVEGEVVSRLSLVVVKTYVLKDETGEITVITKAALPNVGSRREVVGLVETGFSLGSMQSLVLVDESAQE